MPEAIRGLLLEKKETTGTAVATAAAERSSHACQDRDSPAGQERDHWGQ